MVVPAGAAHGSVTHSLKLKVISGDVGLPTFTTVNVATSLVTVLAGPVAKTRYRVPLLAADRAGVVKLALVAPAMFVKVVPPGAAACHWNVAFAGSFTSTLNVAVWPVTTATFAGWRVNANEPAKIV